MQDRGPGNSGEGDQAKLDGFGAILTSEELDDLHSRGARRRFPKGTFLMTEGDISDHVVVILSGQAKVSSYSPEGRELLLAVRGPGELLGDFSALDGKERSASVAALEDLEALMVPAERFRTFLEDHPRLAIFLLQTWSHRVRDADRQRIEFGSYDTAARVARRLVELADRYGEPDGDHIRIALSLSQDELAGWTGASREAVSKALRTFRELDWISTGRRSIIVRDVDALRARSE